MARKKSEVKTIKEIEELHGIECHRIITPTGRSIECPYHDDECPKVKQLRDELQKVKGDNNRLMDKMETYIKIALGLSGIAIIMSVAILGTKAFGLF